MNNKPTRNAINILQDEYKQNLQNANLSKALEINNQIYAQLFDSYLKTKNCFANSPETRKFVQKIFVNELAELEDGGQKLQYIIQKNKSREDK